MFLMHTTVNTSRIRHSANRGRGLQASLMVGHRGRRLLGRVFSFGVQPMECKGILTMVGLLSL